MKKLLSLLFASTLLLMSSANAGVTASGFQTIGFIWSGEGNKCWYKQHEEESSYFSNGEISGNIGVLIFDDSNCMSEDSMGLGHMLNIKMINQLVSKWYSRDGEFKTKENELYGSSLFQEKGKCMQSMTYEQMGITVDYILSENNAISTVYHEASVGACIK